MAILLLFHKHSSSQNSEWMNEINKSGVDKALNKFCQQIPVSPAKLLRTAFGIRALSSTYISRVFIKTEMVLKSRSVLSGSRQLVRSRSSDNLPTSQSQVNIQMMSHTLTIREVNITRLFIIFYIYLMIFFLYFIFQYGDFNFQNMLWCWGFSIYFFILFLLRMWWRRKYLVGMSLYKGFHLLFKVVSVTLYNNLGY